MLNIRIVAVGGLKEKYFTDAAAEYAKRLGRYCKFEIVEVREFNTRDIAANIRNEAAAIREKLRGWVVLCDIGGTIISSEQLAARIDKISQTSSAVTFVVGGSNGVGDNLKTDIHERISFGAATFPHQLFRVMLCEQVYRAFTILGNENYHK